MAGIKPVQVLLGLGFLALAFRSKFNPIVIDPGVVKRYLNRLLINVIGFKIDRKNNSLNLAIQIDNPNPTSINIQSMVGQVYFKDRLLGDVAYYSKQIIEPLKNTVIVLGIRIKDPSIILYVAQFMLQGMKGQEVKFLGNVSVNGQILAVQETFKFK